MAFSSAIDSSLDKGVQIIEPSVKVERRSIGGERRSMKHSWNPHFSKMNNKDIG